MYLLFLILIGETSILELLEPSEKRREKGREKKNIISGHNHVIY